MTNDEITQALERPSQRTADDVPIVTVTHDVETTHGRLRIREHIGRGAWVRAPRRAVLLLPGPVAVGSFFRIPVAGYDDATVLSEMGCVALTVDLLGTGDSERLVDGRACTAARNAAALREAVAKLCAMRGYPPVDVLGESWGAAIGTQLASDPTLVRSCVIVSTLFRDPTPAIDQMARAPEWRGILDGLPDGYLPVGEEIWGPLVQPMPEAVATWAMKTQPGTYAAAPMIAVLDLPYFDPSGAKVPGLVIRGAEDPLVSEADARDLAETYGGPAEAVHLPGAHHIPRVEASGREAFWATVRRFLEAV